MNPKVQAFKDQFAPGVPEFYYHSTHRSFVFKQTESRGEQRWIEVDRDMAGMLLSRAGISKKKGGAERSPAEEMLLEKVLNTEMSLQYCGDLAGYGKGMHKFGGFNAMVTGSPAIPKAVRGDWSAIKGVLEGLFGVRGGMQLPFIYSYLKVCRSMLLAGIRRGQQVWLVFGPPGTGKSFFTQHIMKPFMGGRAASAEKYITGVEPFNGDIMKSEFWFVGDPTLSTQIKDRKALGERIKSVVGNETQILRAMHTDPIQFEPFIRLFFTLNMESEVISGVPPMVRSLRDKVMLFRCQAFDWPVFARTQEEKDAFEKLVESQIPAFCWWLENEFVIPYELTVEPDGKASRFGVNCYHDPDILRRLAEVSPEFHMLELIRQCYFVAPIKDGKHPDLREELRLSALDIEQGLKDNSSPVCIDARKSLPTSRTVTTYLERLNASYPLNVYMHRTSKSREWVLKDIDQVLDTPDEMCDHAE